MLQRGQPVVADFGIALAVSAAGGTRLTETGLSLGTPHYMSPEQATGDRELDTRSDVYSLSAMVYEMLAGEPPHVGKSVRAIIAKILSDTPAPITRTRELVTSGMDAAVHRALAKSPADRFARRTGLSWSIRARARVCCSCGPGGGALDATPIANTEAANYPAISPDSRNVAFALAGAVRVAPIQGGVSRTLADSVRCCIRWSPDGAWLYFDHRTGGIARVPSAGGPVEIVAPPTRRSVPPGIRSSSTSSPTASMCCSSRRPLLAVRASRC